MASSVGGISKTQMTSSSPITYDNTPKRTYATYSDPTAVSISADGEYIAAGDNLGWIYLFWSDYTVLWSYMAAGGISLDGVSISRDGNYMVEGDNAGNVYLFHRSNSAPQWIYNTQSTVYCIPISADGSYVAVGNLAGIVYLFHRSSSTPIWNYATGARVETVSIFHFFILDNMELWL